MVQGTTPTLLFKFSVDLALIKEWRICFYQEGKENLVKTDADCVVDENKVIYVKLTQEETFAFDTKKYISLRAKALTKDNNVIPSKPKFLTVDEMQDKVLFDVENTEPKIIDTSTINFEFDTEPCGFGLDFEELYIEQVGTGGGTDGKDGVGIESVEQTTTSTEDNGTNIITVTLTNGNQSTFVVKNGSKGSQGEKGDKGDKGEQGIQGIQGETGENGKDYVLTEQDKEEIANKIPLDDFVTKEDLGDIESALDSIIAIQNSLIGGDSE